MHHRLPALVAAACLLLAAACTTGPIAHSADQPADDTSPAPAASATAREVVAPTREVLAGRTAYPPEKSLLYDRVRAALSRPDLDVGGHVGVAVVDDQGDTVIQQQADAQLVPASTQKLLTAAAALVSLGPDHRFTTQVRATQKVGPDGVLNGDLMLVGSGDPVLAVPRFEADVWPQRPRTNLEKIANRMVRAGVKRITGAVIGDASIFAGQPLADGWRGEYLRDLDTTRVSGLTVNAGRRLLTRRGTLVGEPADDPTAEAARQLRHLLVKRGVTVVGGARSASTSVPAPVEITEVKSPPLLTLLEHMIKVSDNHLADGIFRALGATGGHASTWSSSAEAVEDVLAGFGLDTSELAIVDGSGLSLENRVTAHFLARLHRVMYDSSLSGQWRDLMAVMGRSGTLRGRLRGTPAEGRTRAKTGTLDHVSALAGSVAADGHRYHFAVIGNQLAGDEGWTAHVLEDEIVLAIASSLVDPPQKNLTLSQRRSNDEQPVPTGASPR